MEQKERDRITQVEQEYMERDLPYSVLDHPGRQVEMGWGERRE